MKFRSCTSFSLILLSSCVLLILFICSATETRNRQTAEKALRTEWECKYFSLCVHLLFSRLFIMFYIIYCHFIYDLQCFTEYHCLMRRLLFLFSRIALVFLEARSLLFYKIILLHHICLFKYPMARTYWFIVFPISSH